MDTKGRKLLTYHRMHYSKVDVEWSLHQKKKWWQRINPTKIDLQDNHNKIEEILRHYNRLDVTVSKHT